MTNNTNDFEREAIINRCCKAFEQILLTPDKKDVILKIANEAIEMIALRGAPCK